MLDRSNNIVLHFGFHSLHAHTGLNFAWVGAKRKREAASEDEAVPLVVTEGGSRRGRAYDNWRLERVRQVLGLVAKHWCEWRQADGDMASGPDIWMYIKTDYCHDELFHETLRKIDDTSFTYNFVGQLPLAILGQLPPSSLVV